MKKNTLKKDGIITSTICVIAILISLIYQFVPCWNYSGIVKNEETGEKRAENMEISLAGYVWNPKSAKGVAFTEYLKDPTLNYAENFKETISVDEYDDEEYAQFLADQERNETILAEANEDPSNAVADVAQTEAPADATETPADATDDASNENVAIEYKDATYSYVISTKTSTTEIIEHHKDITDESYNTVISSSKNNAGKIKRYTEYSNIIKTDYVDFINTMILLPIFVLLAELLSIFLIIFFFRKGVSKFIGTVCTVIIGVLNIIHLFTQPIYLLCQANMYTTMIIVFSIVTFVGLLLLGKDIMSVKNDELISE